MQVPPQFKPITSFVRRAEELEKAQGGPAEVQLVAYYCRQYALEMALAKRDTESKDDETFCLGMLTQLEEIKKKLPPFTPEEGKMAVEDFASNIFDKADNEDRAGNSDKNTARTFYAAANFIDILKQFNNGELEPDWAEKTKYCKWKAGDIVKAIKEGRTPLPGGPEDQKAAAEQAASGEATIGGPVPTEGGAAPPPAYAPMPTDTPQYAPMPTPVPAPAEQYAPMPTPAAVPQYAPPPQNIPPAAPTFAPEPPAPAPAPQYVPPPAKSGGMKITPNRTAMQDAQELAQFALAAMKANDATLAVQRLEESIRMLKS